MIDATTPTADPAAPREKILLRADGAVIGTHWAEFDGLRIAIPDVVAASIEVDERSGVLGLLLAANLFIGAAVLFWLPVIAGYWGPKFLIAVVLLGGVGLSLLQDARNVPDRRVAKLMLATRTGERVVFVSKSLVLVERIADTILSARTRQIMPDAVVDQAPLPRRRLPRLTHRALAPKPKGCQALDEPIEGSPRSA